MGSWKHRAGWPVLLPSRENPEFARRAAAWLSARVLPPSVGRAAPGLHAHPQAAGQISYYCLRAAVQGQQVIRLEWVLPPGLLDRLPPPGRWAVLHEVEFSAAECGDDPEQRLAELEAVGRHLPDHCIAG